ncbi:NfeD family protein [Paenibacillus sp. sptzw28]|uniref:NfeD family protein n=1 Tax=Paenibacillus sp. sptzw28 TaxID=715179 RepID=UPI001C6F5345|nr:NfeD family protein [Paenibacillus sp. sptzw28]QYR23668.1 NfeD family protein [Paenibacillus sp. sptzw28]
METLFLSCLIGGALFAVISVIFGDWLSLALDGALDFLSIDGHPVLQPMTVVGGITVFGGAGMMLDRYSELGGAAVIGFAVLFAVIAGICVYFFYVKPMENSESSTGYSMKELSGVIAEVLVPIPEVGYGEVMIKAGAGVSNQIAASFDGSMIPSGARVVVIEVKDNTLYVSKLEL